MSCLGLDSSRKLSVKREAAEREKSEFVLLMSSSSSRFVGWAMEIRQVNGWERRSE